MSKYSLKLTILVSDSVSHFENQRDSPNRLNLLICKVFN